MRETDYIASVPLFAELDPEQQATIAALVSVRSFRRSAIIVSEGDESHAFFMIKSGRVKVYSTDDQGKEVILNELGAKDYFGELSLLDEQVRSASVMATELTECLVIRKNDFLILLAEQPQIALKLLQYFTSRIRALSDNVKSLALMDVYGRVAKTLLSMAQEEAGELVINQGLTQQDIADRVGASREMVARIMKDLATGGYITYNRRQIVIKENLPERY